MADDSSMDGIQAVSIAKLKLLIVHGCEKHAIALTSEKEDHIFTVQNLADFIKEIIGVPVKTQKLIHKGKCLQDMSASLSSYGVKSGHKIMLLGRKCNLEDDQNYKAFVKVEDSIDILRRKMDSQFEDFNGIKQGYLQDDLATKSVNKLIKKTKGVIEEAMKKLEFIDGLELDSTLKNRRRNLILRIQSMIAKADEFVETLNTFLVKQKVES